MCKQCGRRSSKLGKNLCQLCIDRLVSERAKKAQLRKAFRLKTSSYKSFHFNDLG